MLPSHDAPRYRWHERGPSDAHRAQENLARQAQDGDIGSMGTMDRCVACGFRSAGKLVLMHVEGHTYGFCEHHARQLGPDTPSTTYDLAERLGRIALDRRGGHDRRRQQDRRWFPPRPEGRRHSGRRAEDSLPA